MDRANPNPGADATPECSLTSFTPKPGKHGGAIPRTSAPSPSSAGMIKSLDETIMALTIENKRLEQEVLMKKNLILKSQVPPTIQNKINKKKSDKTVQPDKQASKAGQLYSNS